MTFSFENMIFHKKNNSLLRRRYDLFIQEYAKVTLNWDELICFERFWGKLLTKQSSPRGALTSGFWLKGGAGEGRLF